MKEFLLPIQCQSRSIVIGNHWLVQSGGQGWNPIGSVLVDEISFSYVSLIVQHGPWTYFFQLDGRSVSLSAFAGKVVLIMNVASLWGTTVRDYTQMNQLVEQFGDRLAILAFPCNQFGHQVQ